MTAMTVKKAANSFCGSSVFIAVRDTQGKTRSIAATASAQTMSSANRPLCANT